MMAKSLTRGKLKNSQLSSRLSWVKLRRLFHGLQAQNIQRGNLARMVKITFVEHDGSVRQVEARPGNTVMQTAAINGVPGIEADCGGGCSCATCHVFVDSAWTEVVGPANPTEDAMLSLASARKDNSRLSCQIVVTEEMDGLVVVTPESQY